MAAHSGLDYNVEIKGIADRKLHTVLEEISNTVLLRKERPPSTLPLLRRRVQQDIPRLLKALKAEGYFRASVTADIDTKAKPIRVTFQADPGPAYLLKSVDVQTSGNETVPGLRLPDAKALGLRLGERARARAILDAQEELFFMLKRQGFPFPRIVDRRVVVDHAAGSVEVTFRLEPGPSARFGHTKITGLESVDEGLLRSKIPWQEGDRYNADLLQQVQGRLTATGLFSTVRLTHGKTIDEGGLLDITIAVTERRHRSVEAGVSYKTDEGPGAKISWEHRNLFHRGERLNLSAAVSDFTQAAEGEFRKPEFWREDQSLRLDLRVAKDEPDAYTSRSLRCSVLINRDLSKGVTAGAGLAFKSSDVVQLEYEESFQLLSLPMHFDWDARNDLLDPTRGGRLSLQLAPYYDTAETNLAFVKGLLSTSRYLELLTKPSLVLAGRLAVGAIRVATREAIPADERMYAGGGGSIRGYPFQSVGPLEAGEPVGGRSLLELSTELRWKLTDRFGLVTFLDGGSAFAGTYLDTGEDLYWGAGVGMRYLTPIGPLRLDIGVPLNRRPEVDDSFQVYVSLGQAF
jgi:translocation and assembly module TamA